MDKRTQTLITNDMISLLIEIRGQLLTIAEDCDRLPDMGQAHRLTDNAKAAIEAVANEMNGGDVFN